MKSVTLNSKLAASDICAYLREEHQDVKELEENIPESTLEETPPRKKRSRKTRVETPIVETAVRRSNRVRASNNGFRPNVCKVKNCSSTPPTLSPTSLKKIGVALYQLEPKELEEQELLKKMVAPVGKKSKKDPTKKDDDEEEAN